MLWRHLQVMHVYRSRPGVRPNILGRTFLFFIFLVFGPEMNCLSPNMLEGSRENPNPNPCADSRVRFRDPRLWRDENVHVFEAEPKRSEEQLLVRTVVISVLVIWQMGPKDPSLRAPQAWQHVHGPALLCSAAVHVAASR